MREGFGAEADAVEAVEIELATLFVHDADGWLAPDFTIARTDGAVMVRIRSDLPADLTGQVGRPGRS